MYIKKRMNAFMPLTTAEEDEPGGRVYPFVSLSLDRIPVNIHRATNITQKPTKQRQHRQIFQHSPCSTVTPNTAAVLTVQLHQRHTILSLLVVTPKTNSVIRPHTGTPRRNACHSRQTLKTHSLTAHSTPKIRSLIHNSTGTQTHTQHSNRVM